MSDKGRAWSISPGRVEAFSDGVFAIAITLLVLELRPPETGSEFGRQLLEEWPSYLAYLAAFVMIGSVWLHHHVVFSIVRRVDLRLILVNLSLLLMASVLPFPTAVISAAWRVGDTSDKSIAIVLFAATSLGLSLAYGWLCVTVRGRPVLLRDESSVAFLSREWRRVLIAAVALIAASGAAVLWPMVGLLLVAVIPVFYLGTLSTAGLATDDETGS